MTRFRRTIPARAALALALLALALAACAPTPAPVAAVTTAAPTQTPSPSHTAEPSATETASAVPSDTNTPLPPAATSTRTPQPTHTPPPTSTQTPTPTNTPRPAATFTPLPPTVTETAAPVGAQVFADTVLYPFERSSFVKELDRAQIGMREYLKYFGYADPAGRASCVSLAEMRSRFRNAIGFANVPPDWYPLYVEMWAAIRDAVAVTQPIDDLCRAGGGPLSEDLFATVTAGMDADQNRLYAVQQQAAALP